MNNELEKDGHSAIRLLCLLELFREQIQAFGRWIEAVEIGGAADRAPNFLTGKQSLTAGRSRAEGFAFAIGEC